MANLRGTLLHNEPMSKHTSWRVGGPAENFYKPADLADLQMFLASLATDEVVHWVGLGSNLLVRDGELKGTTIATLSGLRELALLENKSDDCNHVRAEAGVTCSKLAKQSVAWGLKGGAFFAGIPGTVGGAVAMNAGAFGGETWERLIEVETINRAGQVIKRTPEDFRVEYRQVSGPEQEWFVAATFAFDKDANGEAADNIKSLLAQRNDTQPTNQPSGGSTFRNPAGDHAARLIEECGLKGKTIGGAQVSTKHANFIVNVGTDEVPCTAADIEQLIGEVAMQVKEDHGVELIREVHVIGDHPVKDSVANDSAAKSTDGNGEKS